MYFLTFKFKINAIFLLISVIAVEGNNVSSGISDTSCTSADKFICSEQPLECVSAKLTCNGISECSNGADESVSVCGTYKYKIKNKFYLKQNICFKSHRLC